MKGHISLTAVDVDVSITGSETVTQGDDIIVVGVTVVNRVNDLSEAQVSLGYKTLAGLEKLRALFPQSGEGAHFGEMKIVLKAGGPLSNITKDYCMFNGTIVGFSHTKAAGGIQFQLNARGGLYQLSQIIIASPGFHPSTPLSWGLAAISTDANSGDDPVATVAELVSQCEDQTNAFEMYRCIVNTLLDQWGSSEVGTADDFRSVAFEAAIKAYGLGKGNASVVSQELDKVHVGDGLNNSDLFSSISDTAIIGATLSAVQNAQHTFWSFLLEILDEFGLDLVSMGNSTFIIAKAPLIAPVSMNRISASDQTLVSVSDFPFQAPTRCIVTTNADESSTEAANDVPSEFEVAIYPDSAEPTTQEAKTGVKTLYVQVPGFFAYGPSQVGQVFNDEAQTIKHNAATHDPATAKQEVRAVSAKAIEIKSATQKKYQDYAKYMLMKAKFKQRTGQVSLRLKPDVVPGFCARIEDPLGISTFDCNILEVTHVINCQSATAETSLSVNYIRYSGELKPSPFPSPFYPSYSAENTARSVLEQLCG